MLRSDAHRAGRAKLWYVVATVSVGAFMSALDASIVNIALPTLHLVFHARVSDVEWVSLAYLLTLASLLPVLGRIADEVGRSRLYSLGFGVFVVGSALCGAAPSVPWLSSFRVLQAVGAVALQANSVAIVTSMATSHKERTAAIGVQGAAQALGLSVGPFVGGVLIQAFSWRAIFYVNVPIGILGTIAALLYLPKESKSWRLPKMDVAGAALLVLALVAFSLMLTGIEKWPAIVTSLLGFMTLTALVLLVRHSAATESPIMDVLALADPKIWRGLATGALSYTVMYGMLFLLPFFFERAHGIRVAVAGRWLIAIPVAMAVASALAGRIAMRLNSLQTMLLGLLIMVAASIAMGWLLPVGFALLLSVLVAIGLGMGLFTPPNNAVVMGAAPSTILGSIGGILNMARTVGMMLGVALGGTMLAVAGALSGKTSDWALMHAASYRLPFLVLGAATFVAVLLLDRRVQRVSV